MGGQGNDVACFKACVIKSLHTGGTDAVIGVDIRQLQFDRQSPHESVQRVMTNWKGMIPSGVIVAVDVLSWFLPQSW